MGGGVGARLIGARLIGARLIGVCSVVSRFLAAELAGCLFALCSVLKAGTLIPLGLLPLLPKAGLPVSGLPRETVERKADFFCAVDDVTDSFVLGFVADTPRTVAPPSEVLSRGFWTTTGATPIIVRRPGTKFFSLPLATTFLTVASGVAGDAGVAGTFGAFLAAVIAGGIVRGMPMCVDMRGAFADPAVAVAVETCGLAEGAGLGRAALALTLSLS